jgi:uncharacterized membrane protein
MPASHIFFLALVASLLMIFALDAISTKLHVSPWALALIFGACLLFSRVNIPLWENNKVLEPGFISRHWVFGQPRIFYNPPRISNQVIAINVGGAVIPVLFCLYLLPKAPIGRTILATVIVAIVTHLVATPVENQGIEMPIWVAPATAAILGVVLTFGNGAAPLAYIAGTIGTLIGADISNLGQLSNLGPGVLSIGGAGVFDGVFLAGIVAVLLSFERPRRPRYPRPLTT